MSDFADSIDLILAIYGMYLIVCGVTTLSTGKVLGYGKDFASRYTAESVSLAAPALGSGALVVGAAMIVAKLGSWIPVLAFMTPYEWYILIGGALVGVVIVVIGYKKLVEK